MTIGLPVQPSVALAVPVLAGAVESPHCNCLSGGLVTTGGAVSEVQVAVRDAVEEFPQPSAAVNVLV